MDVKVCQENGGGQRKRGWEAEGKRKWRRKRHGEMKSPRHLCAFKKATNKKKRSEAQIRPHSIKSVSTALGGLSALSGAGRAAVAP